MDASMTPPGPVARMGLVAGAAKAVGAADPRRHLAGPSLRAEVDGGIAGGDRTVLAATRTGRSQLRIWLQTPVAHLRDLRSELLLKLLLAENCGIDVTGMLEQQRAHVDQLGQALAGQVRGNGRDVVGLWRRESSVAALRFLDQLVDGRSASAGDDQS
jgi:hypothetical protein